MDTFQQLLFPTGVPDTGTSITRVNRIQDESVDQQIRDSGVDVITAMLAAGRDKLLELGANTEIGQSLIRQTAQQQARQYAPLLILVVVVLLVVGVIGGRLFSGRATA